MEKSSSDGKTPDPGPVAAGMDRQHRKLVVILATLLVVAGALGAVGWWWCGKRAVAPAGGLYFFSRVELPVPQFFQGDERWGSDTLGATEGTLGAEGCAVTSAAMVLAFYGVDTDPQRLNAYLTGSGGYTEQGWIYWEKAAELAPDRVRFAYEDRPSYALIDWNLLRGNPVIVRIRFRSGVTHFVAICGKEGFHYLIRDPGSGGRRGVYPLSDFGSPIEALRYYESIGAK